ncbi:MAG: hypothetical protein DYG94_00300 [Leptolyngbya sp. PLA3]|nr:MAG: hypothetical protein EDM82_01575 [Cyanobacteria bacterium CYA]MCE7967176.1 hypothetical protein [Leptolyngbya sp. PL-A3]
MSPWVGRVVACAVIAAGGAIAFGDWDPGDPFKMHFPQLPDPNGWDVNMTFPKVLADDWLCIDSGWVSDIHFWFSYQHDVFVPIEGIHVSIHADDRSGPFSRPGDLLWQHDFLPSEFTVREWGTGNQGWYDPNTGEAVPGDHFTTWQANIERILDPFWQEQGTIYWLDLSVFTGPNGRVGWKTSLDHFEDDAVWSDFGTGWQELFDPFTGVSLDLAFVITPSPGALALLGIAGAVTTRRRR